MAACFYSLLVIGQIRSLVDPPRSFLSAKPSLSNCSDLLRNLHRPSRLPIDRMTFNFGMFVYDSQPYLFPFFLFGFFPGFLIGLSLNTFCLHVHLSEPR